MGQFLPQRGAGTVISGIIPAAIPVKGAQPEPVMPAPNHPRSPAISRSASVNETAIIKNTGIGKDIFLEIVNRDKAIAAQNIEEFDHDTYLILSWYSGCWWCWRDRPVDRQQILNDLAMLVRYEEYSDVITGQKPDQSKSVQR